MRPTRQRGLSIVELLIAVTLGLVLTAGLISVFVNSKQGYRVQESRSRMQENARFALDYLSRAVRLADFWGSVSAGNVTVYGTPVFGGTGDCKDAFLINPQEGFRGYEGGATAAVGLPAGCISNYVADSDVMLVRYADPDSVVTNGDRPTNTNLTSDADELAAEAAKFANLSASNRHKYFLRVLAGRNAGVFAINDLTTVLTALPFVSISPGAVLNYRYKAEAYYLGNFDPAPPGGPTTPALYFTRNRANDIEATPLVEGIEMMQLEYGLDTNADLVADRYLAAASIAAANWRQVVAVRISLIVRGDAPDNFTDDSTYAMAGGYTYTPPTTGNARRFQRLQIVKEVQIRNRVKPR